MRARSALSAFIAGLAFAATIMAADPASASHVPAWLYPYLRTNPPYNGEVLCGTVGAIHGGDGNSPYYTAVHVRTARTATNCAGSARSGPGEVRARMAAYQTNYAGTYTGECLAATDYSAWNTWFVTPQIDVTARCPAGFGRTLTVYGSYGGWLFDQWYTANHLPQTWRYGV